MTAIRTTLAFSLTLCTLSASAISIENNLLRVEHADAKIVLTSKASNRSFIPRLAFEEPVANSSSFTANSDIWGKGQSLTLQHTNGWRTTLTLFENNPFVQVQTTVVNSGKDDYVVNRLPLSTLDVDLGIDPARLMFLGTGQTQPFATAPGSYAYGAVADPESRRGVIAAWLTHHLGTGIILPQRSDGLVQLNTQTEFGHFLVRPGAERKTDILLLGFFQDARLGLETYADQIVRQDQIQLPPKTGVYCTWYHRNITKSGASTERFMAENADFVSANLKDFGLNVMQIDDHWQARLPKDSPHTGAKFKTTGPVKMFAESNEHFPSGMAATAAYVKSKGLVPGIWFMPFAGNLNSPYFDPDIFAKNPDGTPFHDSRWSGTCIDSTHPKGEAFIRERVRRLHDWGYRYFKIDGLHTGMPSYNIYVNTAYNPKEDFGRATLHNPDMTFVQASRNALNCLHQEAPDTFVLGCCSVQNMRSFGAGFGLVDAMRVGPDNDGALRGDWGSVTKGAKYCSTVWFLNGRVWWNDPDPFYVRESNPIGKARWMASWLSVSGAMNSTSQQYATLSPARLDLIKRSLPTHDLRALPVDILERDFPRIWLVQQQARNLVGLFNFNEHEEELIDYPLARMGLDPETIYDGFDYWRNEFFPGLKGSLKLTLPGAGCKVLVLKERTEHPQILGSSRNINQGVTDILRESWDPQTTTLQGTSILVADDPYELRLMVPVSAQSWAVDAISVQPASVKASFTQEGPGIRVTLLSEVSGETAYSIHFKPAAVQPVTPTQPQGLKASIHPCYVVLSWDDGQPGAYRLTRNDGLTSEVDSGCYADCAVVPGKRYTYTVQSMKWGQLSEPTPVEVEMPASIDYPPQPPKPDIHLSALPFRSASVGWGSLKKDRCITGQPLRINGTTYSKGLGVHANSTVVLDIPPGAKLKAAPRAHASDQNSSHQQTG